MPYILRVDASSRTADSNSRKLADRIENRLRELHPTFDVRKRDLVADPIPHIANETITGFFSPPEAMNGQLREATALSNTLIAELKGAEIVLISTPMYNFGVPSALKAWIDQVVRINETFSFDGTAFNGLVPAKKAIIAAAYGAGGYSEGGDFAAMNFLEPYLVGIMQFLGIGDVEQFRVEGTNMEEAVLKAAYDAADKAIAQSSFALAA